MSRKTGYGVGRRIRKHRRRLKLTQEGLANSANLSPKYIQYLEWGSRVPRLQTLSKIARVLKIKLRDLF